MYNNVWYHYIMVYLTLSYNNKGTATIFYTKLAIINGEPFEIKTRRDLSFDEGIKYLNKHHLKMELEYNENCFKTFKAIKESK